MRLIRERIVATTTERMSTMVDRSLTVRFMWDGDKLGPDWFNEDNLKPCLFSDEHIRPKLLNVEVVEGPIGEITTGFIQLDIAQH